MAFSMQDVDPALRGVARDLESFPAAFAENFKGNHEGCVGVPSEEDMAFACNLEGESRFISRPDGSELRLYIARPLGGLRPGERVPVVLWLHSGGYVAFYPEHDMVFFDRLMRAARCVIVSPDYRLAPEHPYPAALDDAYQALLWARDHAGELGGRSDQIMVGGASAGGGLCAATCLYARDKGEVAIAYQMPFYPMLDDRMATGSSQGNEAPIWNTALNEQGWRGYLGDRYGGDVPAYAAPARAGDLSGLPPACSFVGTLEPFRDEAAQYFADLVKAGVPVDFKVFPGCFHAFDAALPSAGVSREAEGFVMRCFSHAVRAYAAEQAREGA